MGIAGLATSISAAKSHMDGDEASLWLFRQGLSSICPAALSLGVTSMQTRGETNGSGVCEKAMSGDSLRRYPWYWFFVLLL
jgi:hypothetical protein